VTKALQLAFVGLLLEVVAIRE